jgi:hypothetical protein
MEWTQLAYIPAGLLLGYAVLDFVLSMALGRCALPGLRCSSCRRTTQLKRARARLVGESKKKTRRRE